MVTLNLGKLKTILSVCQASLPPVLGGTQSVPLWSFARDLTLKVSTLQRGGVMGIPARGCVLSQPPPLCHPRVECVSGPQDHPHAR